MGGCFLPHAWKQDVLDETRLEVMQHHLGFDAVAILVAEARQERKAEVVNPRASITRNGHRLCYGEFLQHVSQRHPSQFQNQSFCLFLTRRALGLQ